MAPGGSRQATGDGASSSGTQPSPGQLLGSDQENSNMLALARKHQEWVRPLLGRDDVEVGPPYRLRTLCRTDTPREGSRHHLPRRPSALRLLRALDPRSSWPALRSRPGHHRDRNTSEQRLPQWPPPNARNSRLRKDSRGRSCLECHRIARVRQAARRAHEVS